MQFPDSFFEDEVRDGFFVPGLMKRAWAAQMEILADVDKVCKKYNIRWFADRGTLLGAVRHKGYIPWDDDLDICMLRDDYNRFLAVAEKELPPNYYIPRERDADHRMLTTIFSSHTMPSDKEHLKKYHEFPLCAAMDIFVLDYIAPDPEDEDFRVNLAGIVIYSSFAIVKEDKSPEEIEAIIQSIEEMLQVTIDRNQPLQEQLFDLIEQLYSLYTAEEATEVACMPNWIGFGGWKFPLECYKEAVMLPFECGEIAVPRLYLEAVKIQFGENYMQPYRAGGGHEYPSYMKVEDMLTETPGPSANLLSQYIFSKSDLERPVWKGGGTRPGTVARNFVQLAGNIHKQVVLALATGDGPSAFRLLESCQESAIQIGTLLEQDKGEGCATVKLLEEYCELLYQAHETIVRSFTDTQAKEGAPLEAGPAGTASGPLSQEETRSIQESLSRCLDRISSQAQTEFPDKKEVVFLPFKASAWDSLEPLWRAAVADPDCDVYVIPIPYYYKTMTEESVTLHYEGSEFPAYVPVTEYSAYNFEARMPDVIVIHNPYDDCSFATSVHPAFYSSRLQQVTGQLIYTPYFQVDEIEPNDTRSIHNMRYYVSVPGVVRADRVLVQSEQMRRSYIDYLTEFAGEDTRSVWEEKIRVSPFR